MTKTYIQIDPNNIQTSETHADGSFTSGIIRKNFMRKRTSASGEIEEYSEWDELDTQLVQWLDVDTWQAEQDAEAAKEAVKADKLKPKKVKGYGIVLDAANQSELASLIQAANMGAAFPLSIESIEFSDQAELESFFIDYVAARQALFGV